jgi:hypothetical protein
MAPRIRRFRRARARFRVGDSNDQLLAARSRKPHVRQMLVVKRLKPTVDDSERARFAAHPTAPRTLRSGDYAPRRPPRTLTIGAKIFEMIAHLALGDIPIAGRDGFGDRPVVAIRDGLEVRLTTSRSCYCQRPKQEQTPAGDHALRNRSSASLLHARCALRLGASRSRPRRCRDDSA